MALVIFISAILFSGCSNPEPVSQISLRDTLPVINCTDTLQAPGIADTLIILGSTGYGVNMPVDFKVETIKRDTEFLFVPITDTSGCDGLRLLFTPEPGVVPGKRPFKRMEKTVLNQQVEFREYILYDTFCRLRTGSLVGEHSNIRITCLWPEGDAFERLFDIGLSLHKNEPAPE